MLTRPPKDEACREEGLRNPLRSGQPDATLWDVTPEERSKSPGFLARLVEPFSVQVRRALLGGALVALVAGFCAWLLSPGTLAPRLPGDEALGTPALGTITATREHIIQDEAATNEQRASAIAAERSVFDWDEDAAEEAADRIRATFSMMREAIEELRGGRGGESKRRPTALELRRDLVTQRETFDERLGVAIGDEDFGALTDAGFSEEIENALISLVRRGLAGDVVDDIRSISTAGDRGVVVRSVRRGVPRAERVLVDIDQVRSVHAARDEIARAAETLPGLTPPQRLAVGHMASALARPTLVFDLAESARRQQDAADRVKPVVVHVRRGEKIIGDGEIIERHHLLVFHGIREQTRAVDVWLIRLGAAVLVVSLVLLLWMHVRREARRMSPSAKDAVLLASALLASAGLAAGGVAIGEVLHDRFPRFAPETFFYLVPFATGALVIRSVLSSEIALLFAVGSGAVVGLVAGNSISVELHAMLTSVLAAGFVLRTRDRGGLFRIGAAVGGTGALLILATHLFTGRGVSDSAAPALAAALAGGVLMPMLAMATLPVVQCVFGYLTDLRLLELANLNHPALKDLIIQAPGTYHHAVIMGALAEAAAKAVGANALLARVGAYYHDIGKTRNPIFYAENQRNENKHEQLAPAMSALIVKRHVTDGIEVARRWHLPKEVVDIIRQHHGTRRVQFFWARAQARAAESGERLDETAFRYAGPEPQTREAALVMLADVCEASSRALPDPSPERLRTLVHKRVNEVFSDGQLDACELTLKDLQAIAAALVAALEAVYPEQSDAHPGTDAPSPNEPAEVQLQLLRPERRAP